MDCCGVFTPTTMAVSLWLAVACKRLGLRIIVLQNYGSAWEFNQVG